MAILKELPYGYQAHGAATSKPSSSCTLCRVQTERQLSHCSTQGGGRAPRIISFTPSHGLRSPAPIPEGSRLVIRCREKPCQPCLDKNTSSPAQPGWPAFHGFSSSGWSPALSSQCTPSSCDPVDFTLSPRSRQHRDLANIPVGVCRLEGRSWNCSGHRGNALHPHTPDLVGLQRMLEGHRP